MPWLWVNTEYNLTPSVAYTERNIPRIQLSSSVASTQDCLLSLHSHDYELTPECCFTIWCASLQIDCNQSALNKSFTSAVTLWHSHGFELITVWIGFQYSVCLPSTASRSNTSNYPSNLAQSYCASASPNSLDHCLGVHSQEYSVVAFKCISKLTRLQFPRSHDDFLQVHLQAQSITACKCILKVPG